MPCATWTPALRRVRMAGTSEWGIWHIRKIAGVPCVWEPKTIVPGGMQPRETTRITNPDYLAAGAPVVHHRDHVAMLPSGSWGVSLSLIRKPV